MNSDLLHGGGNKAFYRHTNNSDKYFGVYRAEVVDNNDPEKICRLKVRVDPLYKNLEVLALPWAECCFLDGGLNDVGHVFIPKIGSTVLVMFLEGNVDRPIWTGTFFGKPSGVPETPKAARGDNTEPAATDTEPLIDEESYWNPQYPHNRVIRTSQGIVIEYDDTPNEARIHLYHPSGSHMEFRKNGDVVLHVKGNYSVVVDGNVEELYKNNQNNVVQGNSTVSVNGDLDEIIDGAVTEDYGSQTISVDGPVDETFANTYSLDVSGATTLSYQQKTQTVDGIATDSYNSTYTKGVLAAAIENYTTTLTQNLIGVGNYGLFVSNGDIDIDNSASSNKRIRVTSSPSGGVIIHSASGVTDSTP